MGWARLELNQAPIVYKTIALPMSYGPQKRINYIKFLIRIGSPSEEPKSKLCHLGGVFRLLQFCSLGNFGFNQFSGAAVFESGKLYNSLGNFGIFFLFLLSHIPAHIN